MALLELYVGKSKYTIDCHESEMQRITILASRLNQRVNDMSLKMRGADEKTILMLCSIMAEAELESLRKITAVNKENVATDKGKSDDNKDDVQKVTTQQLDNISFYIEELANKIKGY